jgi:chromosome segregation ATPase
VSSHSIAHNEVTFLKEKNKELDERVYKLLKMNTQLKENMEHLLQQRNDHSTLNYFKEQIAELSQKNLLLEQRVKKLLEENERAKGQLGSFSKSEESGQVKVFELERKVVEMQRTINELLHAKASM